MRRLTQFANSKSKKGKLGAVGLAGAAVDGVMNYSMDQSENPEHSKLYSVGESAVVTAGWLLAEPLMWGLTIGGLAKDGVSAVYDDMKEQKQLKSSIGLHTRQDATGLNGGTMSGTMVDNDQAYTMRQRQMDILRQHRMSTESVLGSEARQLHK